MRFSHMGQTHYFKTNLSPALMGSDIRYRHISCNCAGKSHYPIIFGVIEVSS